MYTCGIVEDEYLAQRLLIKYIKRYGSLELAWSLESIPKTKPAPRVDIVFLDLLDNSSNSFKMSEGVIEFAILFPNVIITTAFPIEKVRSAGIPHKCVLTKPYTYQTFENAVISVLEPH